ncbi:LptE family protein [Mucilaginibacter mali]|uniref:LptE family protein n=2 Tax=Mucilaginibacter mali TaxID=2740462 RepID=A0A7D4QP46_9SPHI|nr:LptE family protein [Mucilaginibacter mali]
MKRIIVVLVLFAIMATYSSCSVTLNGASIPAEMSTVDVEYFDNNALFVVNNLSQNFTEALKQRIRSQSRLSIVRTPEADAVFSGAIIAYNIAPVSVQATGNGNTPPIANASRLTITVKVKYKPNNSKKGLEHAEGYEQEFTKTADYTGDIGSQEQALILNITKQLTEDIFNKAFADWK